MTETVLDPAILRTALRTQEAFRRTYETDPVAWVYDNIRSPIGKSGWLAPYQEEALANIPLKKRVTMRGPHGLGKTAIGALSPLWFATVYDGEDWKCVTTAGAWRQLKNYLWPEIHKWARRINWQNMPMQPFEDTGALSHLSLRLGTGQAFAVASN